jgi:hypothetical protein
MNQFKAVRSAAVRSSNMENRQGNSAAPSPGPSSLSTPAQFALQLGLGAHTMHAMNASLFGDEDVDGNDPLEGPHSRYTRTTKGPSASVTASVHASSSLAPRRFVDRDGELDDDFGSEQHAHYYGGTNGSAATTTP